MIPKSGNRFSDKIMRNQKSIAMPPYVPKYISPKQAAAAKARRRAIMFWIAVAIPLLVLLLVFGYSDQAPEFLRRMTITIDGAFGLPILKLIGMIAGR